MPKNSSSEERTKKAKSIDILKLKLKADKKALAREHESEKESMLSELQRKQENEMESLEAKHHQKVLEILDTEDEQEKCALCANSLDEEKKFDCASCDLSFCDSHRTSTTTCKACNESYCCDCLEDIDKCATCLDQCNDLYCCGLVKMKCGDHLCDNCEYYHYKRCGCSADNDW